MLRALVATTFVLLVLAAACGGNRDDSALVSGLACPPAVHGFEALEPLRTFTPSAPHVPGRLVVGLPPSDSPGQARERAAALAMSLSPGRAKLLPDFVGPDAVVLEAPEGELDSIAKSLTRCPGAVRYVELDYQLDFHRPPPGPRDPRWSEQESLHKMEIAEAWASSTGRREVVVAVIDTGIDLGHPDLVPNLWSNPCQDSSYSGSCPGENLPVDYSRAVHGWNFVAPDRPPDDSDGHGTEVAGIIGAAAGNAICIAGISWHVSLVALKIANRKHDGSTARAAEAIYYAASIPADVVNASWSGPATRVVHDAVLTARAAGSLVVAAAPRNVWNDVDRAPGEPREPCGIPLDNVICVTATDLRDRIVTGASVGKTSVDLGATSEGVLTTGLRLESPDGCTGGPISSSIAAPHVTGVAALLRARCPDLGYAELKRRIESTGDPVEALTETTSGRRLNARRAMASLLPECPGPL